jgi:hypothetical protein
MLESLNGLYKQLKPDQNPNTSHVDPNWEGPAGYVVTCFPFFIVKYIVI